MKNFEVPVIYRSPLISAIKRKRKEEDRMKKDFTPTLLDFGFVTVLKMRLRLPLEQSRKIRVREFFY
jgi:4-hydroxy-3-methylbut-2-enyl diphosphate reductase